MNVDISRDMSHPRQVAGVVSVRLLQQLTDWWKVAELTDFLSSADGYAVLVGGQAHWFFEVPKMRVENLPIRTQQNQPIGLIGTNQDRYTTIMEQSWEVGCIYTLEQYIAR